MLEKDRSVTINYTLLLNRRSGTQSCGINVALVLKPTVALLHPINHENKQHYGYIYISETTSTSVRSLLTTHTPQMSKYV
jgi:hypothetical protein